VDILLRRAGKSADDKASSVDSALSSETISIGSAAECTIRLAGGDIAPLHAYLEAVDDRIRVRCTRGNRVIVAGKSQRSVVVGAGEILEVGRHQLRLLPTPAGFDAALEVLADAAVGGDPEGAFRTDLRQTWLSMRATSWMLLFLIFTAALLTPLWAIHKHRQHQAAIAQLPDDRLWSSGPLTQAHAHVTAGKCDACHNELFSHVPDKACQTCHRDTHEHVSESHRALLSLNDKRRCGECHREHLDEQARAIGKDDGLCLGCHTDSHQQLARLTIKPVKGFGSSGSHPAFDVRLSKLVNYEALGGDPVWGSYSLPLKGAEEESNLEFKHLDHLDIHKVRRLDTGKALGCVDCHQLNSGDLFTPVTMAATCMSCHELVFDASSPDRQLPHGRPKDAMGVIEDYFNKKLTDPPPKVHRELKMPLPDHVQDLSPDFEVEPCHDSAVLCARSRAKAAIDFQFTKVGCKLCHKVEVTPNEDIHEQYHIRPVRLGSNYFPDLKFSHKAHEVMGNLSGDSACESCHAARKSDNSRQLLLPDIDKCQGCHRDLNNLNTVSARATAGASPDDQSQVVVVQCISCHEYHPPASLFEARRTEQK
jgi:predicted CXXCH cytochrome family protein